MVHSAETRLSLSALRKHLLKVARKEFGASRLADIRVSPYTPIEGDEGISATVVLHSQAGYRLSTGQVSSMTNSANDFMAAHGDGRFVYMHYATTDDLENMAAE
jgi:hypothetical protein